MADTDKHILELQNAIAALEQQRSTIGDLAVDSALKGIYAELKALQADSAVTFSADGERRHATIVFSDLSGYTAMNESLDPEEVEGILAQIKDTAVSIVESHGGIVNQFVGDEIVVVDSAHCLKPEVKFDYSTCTPEGCQAIFPVDADMMKTLQNGSEMSVGFRPWGNDQTLVVKASLKGSAAAMTKLGLR